jgi:uncharacterized membrane protein
MSISDRPSVFARLRGYFLAGVLVTAPLGITLYLAYAFIGWLDAVTHPLVKQLVEFLPERYADFYVPGLGIVLAVVALILIGMLAANFFGRMVISFSERALAKMPVVRTVYAAIKQILETVFAKQSKAFREVVLVEYPRPGLWAIAFKTNDTKGEIDEAIPGSLVNVFLPTTPNPTSGFLLFVPEKDVLTLDMTVEEAIKFVVSGGIVPPPYRRREGEAFLPDAPV